MRVGLRTKVTGLDMRSQCPEDAGMSSFFGTRAAKNVTRVFWGKAALETMFVTAHTQTNAWGSALEEQNAMRVSASPGNTGLERTH